MNYGVPSYPYTRLCVVQRYPTQVPSPPETDSTHCLSVVTCLAISPKLGLYHPGPQMLRIPSKASTALQLRSHQCQESDSLRNLSTFASLPSVNSWNGMCKNPSITSALSHWRGGNKLPIVLGSGMVPHFTLAFLLFATLRVKAAPAGIRQINALFN